MVGGRIIREVARIGLEEGIDGPVAAVRAGGVDAGVVMGIGPTRKGLGHGHLGARIAVGQIVGDAVLVIGAEFEAELELAAAVGQGHIGAHGSGPGLGSLVLDAPGAEAVEGGIQVVHAALGDELRVVAVAAGFHVERDVLRALPARLQLVGLALAGVRIGDAVIEDEGVQIVLAAGDVGIGLLMVGAVVGAGLVLAGRIRHGGGEEISRRDGRDPLVAPILEIRVETLEVEGGIVAQPVVQAAGHAPAVPVVFVFADVHPLEIGHLAVVGEGVHPR